MAIAFIRILILYILIIFSLRLMGKRQLGELKPIELAVTILISELAAIPIQDLDAPLINSIIPIAVLISMEILFSIFAMKSSIVRNFISGNYNVIIDNGKVNQKEMFDSHLTMDELLEELRRNGAMSISQVRFCILETSGKMSVILNKDSSPGQLPVTLVVDGKAKKKNLESINIKENDLNDILATKNIGDITEVFWMAYVNGEMNIIKKDPKYEAERSFQMTFRGIVALIILAVIISVISFGSYFLSSSTKKMEDILKDNIELITNKKIENAEKKFDEFLDEYEKDRLWLSIFISDTVTKNINMSIEKITKTFEDEFQEALLVEFEELLSNIKSIYNEYSLTIENIF